MASIYDKSSLVLIPSGTKTGKVFSQKPVSGDGDFTFTRSSAATRVNADGNIEKETSNLLLQSNSFNTTWSNTNSTETGGQSGYDGTSNAWKLTISAAGGFIKQNLITSSVQTYSVYAKADTYNFLSLGIGGSPFSQAFFDLQNGTIGTTTNTINATIQSVGSGWYRCSVTFSKTTTNRIIYPCVADNDYTGTSGSIFIQNSQSENGLVARDVITTTTSAVYGGITDNVPRLDYTDSSCPSLKLEPQRTNLFTQSEFLQDLFIINGGGSGGSFTANYGESPEGVDNSVRVQATNTTTSHFYYAMSLTAGTQYAISCYYKGTSGEKAYLNSISTSGGVSAGKLITFNGEWQRETILFTAGTGANYVYIHDARAGGSTATDFEAFGFQVEAGSYPTSYIPTYGSSVTRSKDLVYLTSASDLMDVNGTTFLLEVQGISNGGDSRRFSISDGTYDNRAVIELDETADTIKVFLVGNGSVGASLTITGIDQTNNNKIAVAFDSSGVIVYINGEYKTQDTSITLPTALTDIKFRDGGGSNLEMEGYVKQTIVFPSRLTNTELADLTTL